MTNILLIAALGVAAMAYFNSQSLQKEVDEAERKAEEERQYLEDKINEGKVTPEKVTLGVKPIKAMIGFSSISDKYMNCAAGVVWKNSTNEPINIIVDSATFSVGGYDMIVGVKNTRTITVPANGTIYQDLFDYENKILFATANERKQFRIVIGDAQGHPGKEGRDVWGKANFDAVLRCTYTTVGTLSKVNGEQGVIDSMDAIGRYYGSTALAYKLKSWVRQYIDK